ncbi:helix-turn-helix domain-containing protein [Cellulosilyticum sp. WCF-2]|uniref:helix-turn-helix domain-containing protein n=1 Tax=Cellulosilyticum sp. WCF-2 TaxID=2497860 RepID=UPI000F8D95E6|nr:helix-turn-helix transcriptional regulator [Cellulosilyticum sp. WCF-2]QEH67303.1 helix-turn-helix transcriptional regulator [Cellulosilyticum sp. WCF-2]
MEENILGKRIKQLRTDNNLSQLELSKKLNISNSTLSQYEAGNRTPSDDIKLKIASLFNVSIDYLLGHSSAKTNFSSSKNNLPDMQLTKKDERDIAKDIASIMNKIKAGEDGPIYYNGEEMDQDDADLFEQALEFALRSIKIENKEKYTPKKYRK